MGCFNHIANFSRLPIKWGDRIVVLIGIKEVSKDSDINDMAPGMGFSPIFVPIRGNYDDYGSIENVDKTEAVKLLEERLGKSVEDIVYIAERNDSGSGSQVKEDTSMIFKKLAKMIQYPIEEDECYFGYVMEHEAIFDKLVSMSNSSVKDKNFNILIPSEYLLKLGYTPENLGKDDRDNDIILWKHSEYPAIKQGFYTWLESEFKDYRQVIYTVNQLCEKIGYNDIPEFFNNSYLETMFLADIQDFNEYKKERDKLLADIENAKDEEEKSDLKYSLFKLNHPTKGKRDFTFRKCYNNFGLFYWGESCVNTDYMCCIFNIFENEHLQEKYMKDFIDLSAFIMSLIKLRMPWGSTTYGGQENNYNDYIDFTKACYNFINNKYREYKNG